MTYSKGPWIYDAESSEIRTKDRTGFWGPDHEPAFVATVEPMDGVNNGPLLAAAPELLDALSDLVGVIDKITRRRSPHFVSDMETSEETREQMALARAAIAKATGESK